MNPWLIIGALLSSAVIFLGGYYKGNKDGTAKGELKIAAMVADSQARKEAEATAAFKKSEHFEVENAQAKTVYKTITQTVDKFIDRPVYRNVCLDDDGLRAANAALAGALAAASKPDGAMSGPDSAPGRPRRDRAAETDRVR